MADRSVACFQGGRADFRDHRVQFRDLTHKIGAKAIAAALDGRKKGGYLGSSLSCPTCHESARFVAYRPKSVVSLLGTVRLRRAYYHCPRCQAGAVP